jgi:hypothetical protein
MKEELTMSQIGPKKHLKAANEAGSAEVPGYVPRPQAVLYSYDDMLEAFNAGRKHQIENGGSNYDCNHFVEWVHKKLAT